MARKKKHKGGHHGSNWKLALADQMIALMCVFLTLWIIQFLDKVEVQQLVAVLSSDVIEIDETSNTLSTIELENVATTNVRNQMPFIDDSSLIRGEYNSQQQLEVLARKVEQNLEQMGISDAIDINVTPDGLKMVISDSSKGAMFETGRSRLTPYYEDLFLGLGPVLGQIQNGIVVSGHTDASRYLGTQRTNWELSTERANTARYYLNRGGVPSGLIAHVNGFGSRLLVDEDNPNSPINRRIELFILTAEALERMNDLYGAGDIELDTTTVQTQDDVSNLLLDASTYADDNRPLSTFEAMKNR